VAPPATKPPVPLAPLPESVPPLSPSPADRASSPPRRVVPQIFASGGVAALGPVAGVAGAFSVGAGLRYGAISFDLEGRYLAPSAEAAGTGQVRTSTIGVSLLPCVHRGPAFLCANVFFGALQGAAEGVDAPQQATTFFSQAGVRLGAAIPIARVRLEPFVDGLATLTSTEVMFRGVSVWSSRPVGLSGGIRFVLPFP
jgi:hypothetical protein